MEGVEVEVWPTLRPSPRSFPFTAIKCPDSHLNLLHRSTLSQLIREAIDRQIELERKKRQEIEERKKKELEDERNELKNWQQGLSGQKGEGGGAAASIGGDDDSDYEEDEEEGGTAAAAAAAGASEKPMPDHPDYHGRGWTPSRRCGEGV